MVEIFHNKMLIFLKKEYLSLNFELKPDFISLALPGEYKDVNGPSLNHIFHF